jgi:hypothetical protein
LKSKNSNEKLKSKKSTKKEISKKDYYSYFQSTSGPIKQATSRGNFILICRPLYKNFTKSIEFKEQSRR